MEKYKTNKSVSLKSVELWTTTRLISNKRNRMLLSLVSLGCTGHVSWAINVRSNLIQLLLDFNLMTSIGKHSQVFEQ